MAKANMDPKRTPMPTQDPCIRKSNFFEVASGYDETMAVNEALRCLSCKNMPCVSGCPVNIRIPEFIARVRECDFEGAYEIISSSSALPAVCGRVCPQETQCEGKCTRGIKAGCEAVGIGRLERFVADYGRTHADGTKPAKPVSNGIKVAVVGSGPAGLSFAGDMVKRGYDVTVFEALHEIGGVLKYGIPEFRLPNAIVETEIDGLRDLGVKFIKDCIIGKTITYDDLHEEGFKGIFVASGAGLPRFMGIPGENLNGIMSSNEYLTRINLMGAGCKDCDTPVLKGENVAIIGGGNTAMDSVRTAMRSGAKRAMLIYRRGEDEMPARAEEIKHAKEEGIELKTLCNPIEIIGDENGRVCGMKCVRMELGEPDASGRRRPIEVPDSEFMLDVDTVIMSLGTSPNPLIRSTTPGLETNRKGCLIVDENEMTTREGVFAGGDAVTGAATVILAMGAGKKGAAAIDRFVKGL